LGGWIPPIGIEALGNRNKANYDFLKLLDAG